MALGRPLSVRAVKHACSVPQCQAQSAMRPPQQSKEPLLRSHPSGPGSQSSELPSSSDGLR